MTREEIIRMARQAGLMSFKYPALIAEPDWEATERFAALIAAAAKEEEREELEEMDWTTLMRQGGLVTWGDAQELGDRVVDVLRARSTK